MRCVQFVMVVFLSDFHYKLRQLCIVKQFLEIVALAGRYFNAFNILAKVAHPLPNASHAVRKRYAFKTRATVEYAITNRCYAVGDFNAFKACTFSECSFFNSRYTIWDFYACKACTSIVFTTSYYSIFCE